ncbi:hypothetical protein ACLOJK_026488 [Asimina triloba]
MLGVVGQYPETPAGVLQEIAMKCGTKVWFVGEKIGEGIGKTRKEAQRQAAESSLRTLASEMENKYLSRVSPDSSAAHGDLFKLTHKNENGFIRDANSFGYPAYPKEDPLPVASTSDQARFQEGSVKSTGPVTSLKELCTVEGLGLVFHGQASFSPSYKGDAYAEIEIAGQILGKGTGLTWEEAKLQFSRDLEMKITKDLES